MLAAMPTEACGLAVTTLVVVDGGSDKTDQVAKDSGAVTFVLSENLGHGYALRVGLRAVHRAGRAVRRHARRRRAERPRRDPGHAAAPGRRRGGLRRGLAGARAGTPRRDRFRKAGVRVFSWLMSAMGHTKLTDTSNGYRALRVSMLDDVAYRLVQPQYQTAELLIIAMKRGWRVTERPTVWLPRASGTTKKGKNWLFGFRYGRVVLETWWKVRKEPRHS